MELVALLVIIAIGAILIGKAKKKDLGGAVRQGRQQAQHEAPKSASMPENLPLRTKQYFFARSEAAFLATLEQTLPAGYRVFPNVRLNDLFLITTKDAKQKQGAYARLRDKHVDFLVVALPEHRPVVAIELDGASHDNDKQQYRDAVKDVAFRSAGLPLVRIKSEVQHSPDSLRAVLSSHLSVQA